MTFCFPTLFDFAYLSPTLCMTLRTYHRLCAGFAYLSPTHCMTSRTYHRLFVCLRVLMTDSVLASRTYLRLCAGFAYLPDLNHPNIVNIN